MKKLLTLLALCCLMVTGAWAQTVVATMQQLVGAASTTTATVSPFFTTSVTGGAVYSFTGNGGDSGTYIGGITNDAVDAAFTGSKVVTVAAWVYGRPNGCIFGYGDQNDGVKFLLSTSGTNTSFKTTTKGRLDFTPVNFTLQEDAWNLVAFSVYGKASSTNSYRYYYGTTNGNYSTKTDKTMSTMIAASKFAIGSGNQGSAREVFSSDIANLTIITSDGYLNNPDIASLVGAAPTAVSHNYVTYADGEFTYGPLDGNTWSAWAGNIPAELSALGSTYNATNLKVIEKYYTFAGAGELNANFKYTSGSKRLDIAGVQVFSSTGVQIGADFHVGMAGNPSANNGYTVSIPAGGNYIVRYISTANCGGGQNIATNGKVINTFVPENVSELPVQDGKTYYIYNANWNNNDDVQYYLYPRGSDLALSTSCLEEIAYMWTCVKNGAYYNFRNVATGKWLGHKGMNDNAYDFKLAIAANSEGCLTLYSVDAQRYMLVKNDGSKFDQSTLAENSGYSSKYGFTECSVSDLYFSESLASDKVKWLRAANCSNTGYVMTVKDGDTAGSNLHTDATDAAAEGQLFAFVGNQENGFVIYNKKLGNTYTLTAANTNAGTAATWVLNAETPTKWYLDESQLNASSQPGYGITTSSTSGGRSLNMWAGNGGDAKFYANGADNGGSRWQFSLVDGTPTVIHYVVSGTKAHNDANNYIGVLNITKGTFLSNTYVGTDVNGKTFNAYLPKTQEPISISNTNLHGWNYELTGSDGNYTVTYTAEQTDYQYLAFDKSAQWYRIPAIAKAHNGDLVAIYDYRVCHNDVGFGEVDQVMRRSTDGGATWSAETKIADGNGGGNHFGAAYGDPALVADRESDNMTLITVSGQQSYPGATATSRPMVAALYSSDNGQHWSDPVDITSQFWGSKGAMFQDEDTEAASTTFAYSGFFGSGKILQSRITKVGSYYRLYAAMLCRGKNVSGAYVVYSDDMGRNWSLLGGKNTIKACSGSDEPKVEELPDGSIVLSGRKSYGRYFNIWTWMTKPTAANKAGEGFWGTDVQSNQQTNGISVGSNACNGEILLVDVKNSTTGQPAKLMLQSLPSGNDRSNVEIWYKDVTDDSAYSTVSTFASNWTRGLRVSNTSSAYSTMTEQADGRIGFFYEEGPATYCMVYVPLSISQITNNAYEKEVVPVDPTNVDVTYNIYLGDEKIGEKVVNEVVGEAPTTDFIPDYYVSATGFPETTVARTTSYDIHTSYKTTLPFTPDDKYYNIKITVGGSGTFWWNNENGSAKELKTTPASDTKTAMWTVGGDWYNGFTIQSRADGKYIASPAIDSNNVQANLVGELSDLAKFELVHKSGTAYCFKVKGGSTYLAHTSISTLKLSMWNVESYNGNVLTFAEVGDVPAVLQDKIETFFSNIVGTVGYPNVASDQVQALEAFEGTDITDTNYDQVLATYNDMIGSNDVVMPEAGHAYKLSVRSTDGTKRWYLKNDGGVSTDEADAAIFVMGSSGNEDYPAIFVTNNNGASHLLQYQGATGASYAENTCDFKIEPMVTKSGGNISATKAQRFGTFALTSKGRPDGYTGNPGTIIYKETENRWDAANGAFMNGTYTTAIEMTEVEYPYTAPNLIKNAGDAGSFASIWLPFPMIFPEGVEVYKGTQERTVAGDPYLGLTQVDTNHAVAAGGYIIYSESLTGGIQVQPVAGTPEDKHGEDDAAFFGSTEPDYTWSQFTAAHSGTPYVLANKSKGIGFYKYTGTVLPKGKAIWMKADGSAETVKFGFDDIISAIEALHGNTSNAAIYDLQGHRLDKVQKGQINVINGKKIMFK